MVEQETKNGPQLPYDINGTRQYEVVASTRAKLLQKLKDDKPLKKDSRTTWNGCKTAWYRDCSGSFTCPNTECAFFLQYGKANKIHFIKTGACKICSIHGDWYSCDARKYTAFVNDKKAHVFHYGNHSCNVKLPSARPTELVQKAVSADPTQDRQKFKVTSYYLIYVAKETGERWKKLSKK